MYIKALEQEVLRLKELYVQSTKERDTIAEENRRLKALLASHGISYDFAHSPIHFKRDTQAQTSSSGSISGSYGPASDSASQSSPSVAPSRHSRHDNTLSPQSHHSSHASMAQLPSNKLDYDQIGIDFVLTYDSLGRPVHNSAQYSAPPS